MNSPPDQSNDFNSQPLSLGLEGHYEILRNHLPSGEVFERNYADILRPAIFTNVVTQWPALEKWSINWFKDVHGDVLKTRILKDAYLTNLNIIDLIPELAADVRFPRFHSYDRLTALSIWMGIGGSKAHCDFAHNLFAQIQGTKIIHLYAPTSLLAKYPFLGLGRYRGSWRSCFSEIDLEDFKPRAPDAEAFSDLKPDYSFEIKPGEMLFLPYGWWHRVLTPEPTISINQWWLTPAMVARIPVDYVRRTLRRALQSKG